MLLWKAVSLAIVIAVQVFSWASSPETWLFDKGVEKADQSRLVQVYDAGVDTPQLFRLPVRPETEIDLTAAKYGLVDLHTGYWLSEKEGDQQHAPASITKLMTALVVFDEVQDLGTKATVSRKATLVEGKKVDLVAGERFSIDTLLRTLLIASGNDSAIVLAEHVGGSVKDFVVLMNEKAQQLGMQDTVFKNPTGLDEDGHLSTVRDLSLLARFFWSNASRAKYSQGSVITLPGPGNRYVTRRFYSTNELINPSSFDLWAAKTGTTDESGESLIYTAKSEDLFSVAILLDSESRFAEAAKLLNWGFQAN
ncbi:D-alanyl-D-alanine carboxypeptidase family protein [Patescibacteria group bacterium]